MHLAVIWKAGWNPGEGVSVWVICNLVHTVQNKDHGLAAGGFLHQILAMKNVKIKMKVTGLGSFLPVEILQPGLGLRGWSLS